MVLDHDAFQHAPYCILDTMKKTNINLSPYKKEATTITATTIYVLKCSGVYSRHPNRITHLQNENVENKQKVIFVLTRSKPILGRPQVNI